MSDVTLELLNRRAALTAVRQEAARIGADGDALLDSKKLYAQVTALDPDEPGFTGRVRELVGEQRAARVVGLLPHRRRTSRRARASGPKQTSTRPHLPRSTPRSRPASWSTWVHPTKRGAKTWPRRSAAPHAPRVAPGPVPARSRRPRQPPATSPNLTGGPQAPGPRLRGQRPAVSSRRSSPCTRPPPRGKPRPWPGRPRSRRAHRSDKQREGNDVPGSWLRWLAPDSRTTRKEVVPGG